MTSSVLLFRVSAALVGAVALTGAAVPVRADGSTSPPFAHVEGVVADASATSVKVRPPVGDPVALTIAISTQIHVQLDGGDFSLSGKAGAAKTSEAPSGPPTGEPSGPPSTEEPPTSPEPGEPPAPSPETFKGLYARAAYDSNNVATELWLTAPRPLTAIGFIDNPSADGFSLNRGPGAELPLAVKSDTKLFLDGRPATLDKLAGGDRAAVLYFMTEDQNVALFVRAQMAPPLTFDGLVSVVGTDSFGATSAGSVTMTFKVDSQTALRMNGKPCTLADLSVKPYVHVLYRARGGANLALRVSALKPKANDPGKGSNGDQRKGVDSGKGKGPTNGGDSGKATGGDSDKGKGNPTTGGSDRGKGKGGDSGKGRGGDPGKGKGGDPGKGTGGDSRKGPAKPKLSRPIGFAGVVTVVGTDGTFSAKQGDKTLTFNTNSKTTFRLHDKPATFADLKVGERVYVQYLADGSVAVAVGMVQPKASGGGGGAGKNH